MLPMIWGSRAATALPSSPDSTRNTTDIGFDLACSVQRGAVVSCFVVACAPRSTVLAPAAPGLPCRNVLIKNNRSIQKGVAPSGREFKRTVAGAALSDQK